MIDKSKTGRTPDDQPDAPIRRSWHAPQFVVSDFALTENGSNAGHDGGIFPAPNNS
jgi:hypothetical protein